VANRGDPCALVDIQTHIPLLAQPRLACVQTHAHPDRTPRKRTLSVLGSRHRIGSTAERNKERITLRIHLDPVVRRKRGTQTAAMLVQRIAVTVAELLQQPCGALYIREEQRDDTRGKIPRHRKEPSTRFLPSPELAPDAHPDEADRRL
jgi:hypothetical protein